MTLWDSESFFSDKLNQNKNASPQKCSEGLLLFIRLSGWCLDICAVEKCHKLLLRQRL